MIFENLTNIQIGILIIFHFILGLLMNIIPGLVEVWYYGLLGIGISILIGNQNKNEIAALIITYFTCMEIVFRMTQANVPWEGVKYILVFVSFISIASEKIKKSGNPSPIYVYFLFLIPSVLICEFDSFKDARSGVSFNLSGPLSLLMSTYYFYQRKFSISQLRILFLFVVLPLITTCAIIALRAPTLSEIKFQDAANFELSGGYGPNQVSSLLGFGVVVMMTGYFLNMVITVNNILDRIITFIFLFFCIINFSRGGIFTAITSVVLGSIVWIVYSKSNKKNTFIFNLVLVTLFSVFIFNYFDNITGNTLSKRYAGTTSSKQENKGSENENFGSGFSGREDIVQEDFEVFKRYPILGVGPGMSAAVRYKLFDDGKPPHTEFSRLISEHGILGLISLFILIYFPILSFIKSKEFHKKLFLIMFSSFSIICSFHAAMRISMMGFVYGIAFINLVKKRDDLADPVKEYKEKSMIWEQFEQESLS